MEVRGQLLGVYFPSSLQTQAAHIKGSQEPLFLYPLFRKHRYKEKDFEAVIKNEKDFETVIKKTHVFEPTIKLEPQVARGELSVVLSSLRGSGRRTGCASQQAPALSPVFMSLEV